MASNQKMQENKLASKFNFTIEKSFACNEQISKGFCWTEGQNRSVTSKSTVALEQSILMIQESTPVQCTDRAS